MIKDPDYPKGVSALDQLSHRYWSRLNSTERGKSEIGPPVEAYERIARVLGTDAVSVDKALVAWRESELKRKRNRR